MGSPTNEQFRKDNEVQRKVTLTEPFWLADSEVPQDLWNVVMGTNRCRWNDGQAFCRKLNAAIPDLHITYPTEAQWEYACRASSRPDIAILCYPVIKIDQQKYSCLMLLGTNNPPQELVDDLSADKRIRPDSPPTFFLHTWEDDTVKMENSWDLAAALRKAGVPFEFHLFEKGKHGLSMCDKPPFKEAHPWAKDLIFWLEIRNFVNEEGTEP